MLRELQTFLAVVRHGSFAAAGERIGLTQSAVSAQMQRLEAQLGHALFDRDGRSAKLNARGRETAARAEQIVALWQDLGAPPTATRGLLRIGAIASAQSQALLGAIAALRREFAQTTVRIVPGVSLQLLGAVDGGELDLALMIRPPFTLPRELTWQRLWSERFELIVPAACKAADWREALATLPFVRYDRTSFGGRIVEQFLRAQAVAVDDAIELDELGGLLQAVQLGLGAALIPAAAALQPWPDGVRALSLPEPAPEREIGILTRAGEAATPAAARLVGLLVPPTSRTEIRGSRTP